jgi:xanthine dehydrogenase accessory factor
MSLQSDFASIVERGERAALATVVAVPDGSRVCLGAKLLVDEDVETTGSLGTPELDAAVRELAERLMWSGRAKLVTIDGVGVFVDITAPSPRLLIVGASDLAGSLAAIAGAAGWRPFVIDPRSRFSQPRRFPAAEAVLAKWPEEAFEQLGGIDQATWIVAITHDPKLDDSALSLALRSEPAYIGAMGSRRAQADRRERLLALGFEAEALARIAAPVGLDLGAVGSAETAISIVAEMIAHKYGRDGGRLSAANTRIHQLTS